MHGQFVISLFVTNDVSAHYCAVLCLTMAMNSAFTPFLCGS